ncbi:ANTAR domain-containing protein [Pseudarthrobacter sp. YALA5]|uniref:GAF and ANTAR domain-containing protein n=1 Tax=Pseudarthrobacter sp. DSP2-3-2b1 TaxID=2804661 RepID=UPI00103F78B3
MGISTRAERVSVAFVKITDTLVADYDVVDLLHTLVEESVGLLDVAAAGLLLADSSGELQVVASTSEESRLVEILQLQAGAGPCVECYLTGKAVDVESVARLTVWQDFRDAALSQGFHSVHAVPMRVHGRTIGAMGLFGAEEGALTAEDAAIGQALADVATISLMQERTIREAALVNEQLQRALNTRVLIEQAKGVIAHTAGVDMDEAFNRLRSHARAHSQSLHATAGRIVDRSLTL